MKQKTFETICSIVCLLGFMFMLGTVGAMEHDIISLGRGIIQSAIGLAIFAGAGYLGGFMR